MALFKNSYSGIITGGLGMGACCGLITMGFSVFFCKIEVIVPPQPPTPPIAGGGGGGGFYVPFPSKLKEQKRYVSVTVKMNQKTWRKLYTVDLRTANIVVKAMNVSNSIKQKISIGVSNIKHVSNKIIAIFDKSQND